MGLPPSEAGAVQLTVACPLPATAVMPVGGSGGPVGVTAAEGADAALVPTALAALTVKVYGVPLESPDTTALKLAPPTAAVVPPGLAVTVYPVIALPPSAGASHVTAACPSPNCSRWSRLLVRLWSSRRRWMPVP